MGANRVRTPPKIPKGSLFCLGTFLPSTHGSKELSPLSCFCITAQYRQNLQFQEQTLKFRVPSIWSWLIYKSKCGRKFPRAGRESEHYPGYPALAKTLHYSKNPSQTTLSQEENFLAHKTKLPEALGTGRTRNLKNRQNSYLNFWQFQAHIQALRCSSFSFFICIIGILTFLSTSHHYYSDQVRKYMSRGTI